MLPLGIESEINHHDRILFVDPDELDDSDQ